MHSSPMTKISRWPELSAPQALWHLGTMMPATFYPSSLFPSCLYREGGSWALTGATVVWIQVAPMDVTHRAGWRNLHLCPPVGTLVASTGISAINLIYINVVATIEIPNNGIECSWTTPTGSIILDDVDAVSCKSVLRAKRAHGISAYYAPYDLAQLPQKPSAALRSQRPFPPDCKVLCKTISELHHRLSSFRYEKWWNYIREAMVASTVQAGNENKRLGLTAYNNVADSLDGDQTRCNELGFTRSQLALQLARRARYASICQRGTMLAFAARRGGIHMMDA